MFKTRLLKWSKACIFGVAASIQTLEQEEERKGLVQKSQEAKLLWRSMARSNEEKIQVRASGVQTNERAREEERERVGACVCVING